MLWQVGSRIWRDEAEAFIYGSVTAGEVLARSHELPTLLTREIA